MIPKLYPPNNGNVVIVLKLRTGIPTPAYCDIQVIIANGPNEGIWIVPLVTVLLLFGVLIALAQSSVIAPFIYTLF